LRGKRQKNQAPLVGDIVRLKVTKQKREFNNQEAEVLNVKKTSLDVLNP
jgi:hypothetical protein